MRRCTQIFLFVLLVFGIANGLWAADVKGLLKDGMQGLGIEKGSPNLLALTNATYVKVNGKTSEGYVDMIQGITGCSMGKGNLLFFHRPITYPLKIIIFRKDTKNSVLITYNGKKADTIKFNMDGEKASDPDGWQQIQKKIGSLSDTFSMVTIANAWAKSAPYDFLKVCEFHNHLCPGVS